MAQVFIEETTLTAIADSIRGKEGTTDLVPVNDMATRITNLPSGSSDEPYFADEDLIFTGNCDYLFASDRWQPVIEKEKGRIKIVTPNSLRYMLQESTGEDYSWLTIEGNPNATAYTTNIFYNCRNMKKLPKIRNLVCYGNQCGSMIYGLYRLTDINELIQFFDNITISDSSLQGLGFFRECYSLRNVDAVMPYIKKALANYKQKPTYDWASRCCGLDEINNIPIYGGELKSSAFGNFLNYCGRLKNITFETNEDGTPVVANWKNQNIDLITYSRCGYMHASYINDLSTYCGITADKEVTDDESYQRLKNDPDWWTQSDAYSRYNHDSAVNTINSLPDTSAYLAANGGTNTIEFRSGDGYKTDGGGISSLTEEEIAVAAAKGWTVAIDF